ncbi:hypothetical protein LINPERHAP1_LOCUS35815 [Linum perenne]
MTSLAETGTVTSSASEPGTGVVTSSVETTPLSEPLENTAGTHPPLRRMCISGTFLAAGTTNIIAVERKMSPKKDWDGMKKPFLDMATICPRKDISTIILQAFCHLSFLSWW